MTLADKLRKEGFGGASFTKDALMSSLETKLKKHGSTSYIIGRHVGTDVDGNTIGTCNPANRPFLLQCLKEEGFKYYFDVNSYGVEHITIYL